MYIMTLRSLKSTKQMHFINFFKLYSDDYGHLQKMAAIFYFQVTHRADLTSSPQRTFVPNLVLVSQFARLVPLSAPLNVRDVFNAAATLRLTECYPNPNINLYIHLRRPHDCLCVSVATVWRRCGFSDASLCVTALLHLLILGKCYAVHINASSL